MFRLILETAQADERIRAAFLNGSRANPKVEPDRYRDYDVVFAVTEIDSFRTDPAWPSRFGEPAIIQEPMCNRMDGGEPEDCSRKFIWLMLFRDGVRLDLQIQRLDLVRETYGQDSLTVPLLDKDGLLPPLPPSDDSGYYVKKPTFTQYAGCTNEFWWCLNNVAKGIVRDQLPYVKWMFDSVVREALDHMADWYIGVCTGFSVSVGMAGKYYKNTCRPPCMRSMRPPMPTGNTRISGRRLTRPAISSARWPAGWGKASAFPIAKRKKPPYGRICA
jgi:aminoglycoside 6-adenylyltransferase